MAILSNANDELTNKFFLYSRLFSSVPPCEMYLYSFYMLRNIIPEKKINRERIKPVPDGVALNY
jgi:hypothetical protein